MELDDEEELHLSRNATLIGEQKNLNKALANFKVCECWKVCNAHFKLVLPFFREKIVVYFLTSEIIILHLICGNNNIEHAETNL